LIAYSQKHDVNSSNQQYKQLLTNKHLVTAVNVYCMRTAVPRVLEPCHYRPKNRIIITLPLPSSPSQNAVESLR